MGLSMSELYLSQRLFSFYTHQPPLLSTLRASMKLSIATVAVAAAIATTSYAAPQPGHGHGIEHGHGHEHGHFVSTLLA